LPAMPTALAAHAQFAADALQRSRFDIDGLMQRHQLGLADRQCAMAALSRRIQNLIVMFNTCLWASRQDDELIHSAAEVLCNDLKSSHTGTHTTDAEYRTATGLGAKIAEGGFKAIAGIEANEILQPYEQ